MISDIWTLTSAAGETRTCDAWGIEGMRLRTRHGSAGQVSFSVPGAMDGALLFPKRSVVTLQRNGVNFFQGPVTATPRRGSGTAESCDYVVSDPWWYLTRITFQQMVQAITATVGGGAPTATVSTTVSRITATQSLDGSKLDLVSTIKEVLIYALYSVQGVPFPATVQTDHLPAIPPLTGTKNPPPFLIGTLPETINVPYFEVRDRHCDEIILHLLRNLPDAVIAWDFSGAIPVLNITSRAQMAASAGPGGGSRTIQLYGGAIVYEGFDPDPQYDLQVSGVIVKYEQNDTVDGENFYVVNVDKCPATVLDNAPDVLIQTVDLIGSTTTLAKQKVTVRSRPHGTETGAQAINWLLKHNKDMAQYDFTADNWTAGHLDVAITTVVDPGAPALKPPFDMPADGSSYNYELVEGAVTPWMWDDDSLLAAPAHILFQFSNYLGSDTKTQNFLASQTPPGTVTISAKCTITNAGGVTGWTDDPRSADYQTIASQTAGESAPTGYAETLYNILSKLHQKGTLLITEQECSNLLPIGCVFNTVDGLAEWQTMDALVLSVDMDIDHGTTKVTFGPTLYLDAQGNIELRRANRGRLPSYTLDQRTTGVTSVGTAVEGITQGAASSSGMPPGGGSSDTMPFAPSDASMGATMKVALSPGTVNGSQPDGLTSGAITVAAGAGTVYVQYDFTYDAFNTVTKVDNTFQSTTGAVPSSVITPSGSGGGSGTFYWPVASLTGVVTGGKASTTPKRLVNGSFTFGVCNGAILLPS